MSTAFVYSLKVGLDVPIQLPQDQGGLLECLLGRAVFQEQLVWDPQVTVFPRVRL